MPIGIIVLGCVMFVCVTAVVLKYLDKRDVNADIEFRDKQFEAELREKIENSRPLKDRMK